MATKTNKKQILIQRIYLQYAVLQNIVRDF